MKKSKDFMDSFMATLSNMKKYQGIDITKPETYGFESGIVHEAFDCERKIAATIEQEEIETNQVLEGSPKRLMLTSYNKIERK